MNQPAFDPTMFGGQPGTPPVPMVVCWDDLDPTTYTNQLTELADWISWLRATYRIPATVIPPCWFTHPGLREDIGHLWTGWLLTRHPDAGVGMIGLDWDQRRDATISRLREAAAVTGCTATRHQAEPEPAVAPTSSIDQMWREHVDTHKVVRARSIARQAVIDIVIDILEAAELRHDLAPTILAEITENPAVSGEEDKEAVAERLRQFAVDALARAATSAKDAASTAADAEQHSAREQAAAEARADIAETLAASTLRSDSSDAVVDETACGRWLHAVEELLPARIAADRAAAAAAARSATVDQRAAARHRHPSADGLLK